MVHPMAMLAALLLGLTSGAAFSAESPTLSSLPAAPILLSPGDPKNPCPGTTFWRSGDRFEGGEDISISGKTSADVDQPSGDPRIGFGWHSKNPGAVSMRFEQTLVTWRYLKCTHTAALLDGRKVELPVLDVDGEVWQHGYVKERVVFGFVGTLLRSLAAVQKFEYRVCGFEFEIPEENLCALRLLAKVAIESDRIPPRKKKAGGR